MSKYKRDSIDIQGSPIDILIYREGNYISLVDRARNLDVAGACIEQMLKTKETALFLGVWERGNTPATNSLEFEGIHRQGILPRSLTAYRKRASSLGSSPLVPPMIEASTRHA